MIAFDTPTPPTPETLYEAITASAETLTPVSLCRHFNLTLEQLDQALNSEAFARQERLARKIIALQLESLARQHAQIAFQKLLQVMHQTQHPETLRRTAKTILLYAKPEPARTPREKAPPPAEPQPPTDSTVVEATSYASDPLTPATAAPHENPPVSTPPILASPSSFPSPSPITHPSPAPSPRLPPSLRASALPGVLTPSIPSG